MPALGVLQKKGAKSTVELCIFDFEPVLLALHLVSMCNSTVGPTPQHHESHDLWLTHPDR